MYWCLYLVLNRHSYRTCQNTGTICVLEMAWDISFVHTIYRYLKHDELSYIWGTNMMTMTNQPPIGTDSSVFIFYWPVNISMFTNHSIANTLWRARKDLYNYAHTTTLILHLILQKLLGLENHDDPSQLSSSYCSFKLANELYIVTTSLRHVAFFLLYLTPDDTRTIFYSHIYIYIFTAWF